MASNIVTSLIIRAMQQGAKTPKEIVESIAGSYEITDNRQIKKTGGNTNGTVSNGQEVSKRRGNG